MLNHTEHRFCSCKILCCGAVLIKRQVRIRRTGHSTFAILHIHGIPQHNTVDIEVGNISVVGIVLIDTAAIPAGMVPGNRQVYKRSVTMDITREVQRTAIGCCLVAEECGVPDNTVSAGKSKVCCTAIGCGIIDKGRIFNIIISATVNRTAGGCCRVARKCHIFHRERDISIAGPNRTAAAAVGMVILKCAVLHNEDDICAKDRTAAKRCGVSFKDRAGDRGCTSSGKIDRTAVGS